MKNSILFAAAALLALPAVAHADPDVVQDRFRVIHLDTGADREWGGGFQSQDWEERPIWCIDEIGKTHEGMSYNVWVTRMSGNDFSKTKLGNAAIEQYRLAAFMTSFYTNSPTVNIGGTDYAAYSLQAAIWRVMGTAGTTNSQGQTVNPTERDAIYDYFQTAVIPGSFDFQHYYVVTARNPGCNVRNESNLGRNCDYQEFITYDPSRPQETVPEPATMTLLATGLAGMAAARRRRKAS
jgi:hypothetical protein